MFTLEVDEQISLVFLQQSFAEALYALVDKNRKHLGEWMPWVENTRTVADIESFIARSITGFAKSQMLVCGILYQKKLAGIVSFNTIDHALKKVLIGYWLDDERQGNGIVTRCCKRLIDYAFDDMHMDKVEIRVATENHKSRRVCERLGFVLEGEISNSENLGKRIVAHAVYGLHR